jgi:hypothetical protein
MSGESRREEGSVGPGTRLALTASSFVLVAGLSACGGDESSESVTLPSEDPTSLPSVTGPTAESAQHFIRTWAAAEARMQNSGRTAAYLALSQDCAECRDLAKTIHGYYVAGGYVRTHPWRIDAIDTPPTSQGVVLYVVHGQAPPATIKASSTKAVEHIPGRTISYLIGVLKKGDSYTVTSRTPG